ncbi:hypothetical protein Pvag_pPag20059 (plasmid) [Pantoea vagans C9-1]|nr:hypothetical protein Pvag_pPag20059 [Pantoea vagans C9-1]
MKRKAQKLVNVFRRRIAVPGDFIFHIIILPGGPLFSGEAAGPGTFVKGAVLRQSGADSSGSAPRSGRTALSQIKLMST